MKEVLRNSEGVIEKVKVANNIFLSKEDADLFYNHQITEDEVYSFFGESNLLDELQSIANMEYDANTLRYDIMTYNELFKNK